MLERGQFGERLLRFEPVDDFFAALERIGHMPLPPYIHRDDADADRERYQTVFSRERGSVAAPTAGLHFTPQMLDVLTAKGVEIARVTLHVGLGTFAPLRVERRRRGASASRAVLVGRGNGRGGQPRCAGRPAHCCRWHNGGADAGTLRGADSSGELTPHSGVTEIFIAPGFKFRLVSGLLTNFHLPQSSLLMLVSAFAGRELVLAAYRACGREKYRFFSYGDCMFLS